MKKTIYLLLLLIQGLAYAQPAINQPTNLEECLVGGGSSIVLFNLTDKESEILNGLNPSLYVINYFETNLDAQNNTNPIVNITNYNIGYLDNKQVYVRVSEVSNINSFSVTYFLVQKLQPPFAGFPQALHNYETAFDGFSSFNLTLNENVIRGTNYSPYYSVFYFPSVQDATNNTNVITNPASYVNVVNEQIIGVRLLNNSTGCYSIRNFKIVVVDVENVISIPDLNFKNKLIASSTSLYIALDVNMGNIKLDKNNDGQIQAYEATLAYYLYDLNSNATNYEGLQYFVNLKELWCDDSLASSISLPSSSGIESFYCQFCSQLSNINVQGLSNLEYLTLSNTLLTTINLNGCNSLFVLDCYECNINTIDLTSLANLGWVSFFNNNLTSIDFSGNPLLQGFNCEGNDFSILDFSNSPYFYNLKCRNNPNLSYINLKNGRNQDYNLTYISSSKLFEGNPNLNFICCDEAELSTIQSISIAEVNSIVPFNSYCSFTPGGDYNTITGAMIFDANTNGCDALDLPQPNIKININDGTAQGSTFTNNSGNYNFYTEVGSFVVTPSVENSSYFTFSPTSTTVPFANDNNNVVTQNFCITANGVHPDLEIVIAPIVPARPGFDAVYQIVYKNKGNQTLSQLYGVNFFFNQNLMDFVSSTTTPSTVGPGSLSWSYANLLPFENRSIYVTLNINTPTDATNPVNIGDVLQFTTSILPMAGDESTIDNTYLFNQTVVGSFDPNNIICMEGNVVSPSEIGDYLHYVINFENTGTSEAENIVVKTEVNVNDFDINSLQMLATSHNAYIRVENNKIEFIFQNIMLDTGGHGNVLLKIRSKSNLVTGDIVSKKADIFFDYNFPIDTGMANTTFQALSTGEFVNDNSIKIYPNPAANFVTINSDSTINSIQLYDVQGRLLQTKIDNQTEVIFDVSNQSNGIYFFKIQSDNGVKVVKLIKE